MKNIVIIYNTTGECEISIPETVKAWDKRWNISQWGDEYTLCHHNRYAKNFTRTDLKVRISESQANELITSLKLTQIKSPIFKSGTTWVQ